MRKKALKKRVLRALRGGSFDDGSWGLRTTSRNGFGPEGLYGSRYFGFRLIARKVR